MVTPRQPPNLEYITVIEAACTKLRQQVLSPPKPNLTKAQNSALRELKRDRDHIVLTADKGVAMVIMDRQDYINKANQLLNQSTYRSITKDPTSSIKNKLINILKRVKNHFFTINCHLVVNYLTPFHFLSKQFNSFHNFHPIRFNTFNFLGFQLPLGLTLLALLRLLITIRFNTFTLLRLPNLI